MYNFEICIPFTCTAIRYPIPTFRLVHSVREGALLFVMAPPLSFILIFLLQPLLTVQSNSPLTTSAHCFRRATPVALLRGTRRFRTTPTGRCALRGPGTTPFIGVNHPVQESLLFKRPSLTSSFLVLFLVRINYMYLSAHCYSPLPTLILTPDYT